jgi:putative membrane protein
MNTLINALASDQIVVHDRPDWWPIFPILWFLAIATVIVVAFRVRRRRWGACGPQRSGHATLAERFAAGEIDADEYRARKAVLDEATDR